MTNKEAIEQLICIKRIKEDFHSPVNKNDIEALNLAIKALEKDKCSTCKHYDVTYGDICLNPSGTCRVFEYDGYEPKGE